MKITYLNHSGFCVELKHHVLIFDFVLGKLPIWDEAKDVYFFVSHHHGDHLHPHLEKLMEIYPKAHFVLSDDITLDAQEAFVFVSKNQSITYQDVCVDTFESTDEGVAFLVSVEGKSIYHAGDLHWWHWPDDTVKEASDMRTAFFQSIQHLQGKSIDVAFLVLDPRLQEHYWLGFDAYMRLCDISWVIGMHCWGQYEYMDQLLYHACSEPYRDRIITYDHEGQVITLGGK